MTMLHSDDNRVVGLCRARHSRSRERGKHASTHQHHVTGAERPALVRVLRDAHAQATRLRLCRRVWRTALELSQCPRHAEGRGASRLSRESVSTAQAAAATTHHPVRAWFAREGPAKARHRANRARRLSYQQCQSLEVLLIMCEDNVISYLVMLAVSRLPANAFCVAESATYMCLPRTRRRRPPVRHPSSWLQRRRPRSGSGRRATASRVA